MNEREEVMEEGREGERGRERERERERDEYHKLNITCDYANITM